MGHVSDIIKSKARVNAHGEVFTPANVIRKIEPELFKTVTGLTVDDFDLLVSLNVFNAHHINQGIFAFRRYEDSSLSYTGIESHENLRKVGLFNTVLDSPE